MKKLLIPASIAVGAVIFASGHARADLSPAETALKAVAGCDSALLSPGLTAAERDSITEEKAYQYALATMHTMRAGDYARALVLIDSAMPIATDPEVRKPLYIFRAKAWSSLGNHDNDYGRFDSALVKYDRAIEAYSTLGSAKDVAAMIGKKADVYSNRRNVPKAEETLSKAWIGARMSGDQEAMVSTLTRIKNFARNYRRHSLYLSATYSLDSLRPYVSDPSLRMDIATDFAETAIAAGNFQAARAIYTEILSEQDSMPASNERNVLLTGTIDKLADICMEMADYDDAIAYNVRNLELKRTGNTLSPFGQALVLNRLSENYAAKGDTLKAKLYADSVIGAITPETDPFFASYMYVLGGICYRRTKDYEDALEALTKGYDLDNSHSDILPLVSLTLAELDRAPEGMEKIRSYTQETGEKEGYDSPNYARMLRYTGQIEQMAGEKELAAQSMAKAMHIHLSNIRSRLRFIPSGMRKSFISALTELVAIMSEKGISDSIAPSQFTTAAYEGLLLNKGLLLASEQSTAELVNRHGTREDKAEFARMEHLRSRLEIAKKDPELSDSVGWLSSEIMAIDERLAHSCASYGDVGAFGSVTYKDILSAMKPGETLVDITSYEKTPKDRKYVAYVLKPGEEFARIIPLCSQEAIDSLRDEARGDLSRLHSSDLAVRVRKTIFDPIVPYLTPGVTTYLVPSGSLLTFSPEVLPLDDVATEESSPIVAERYPIVRLSSARNIVDPSKIDPSALTASLYGGIIYDMDADEMALASMKVDDDMAASFALRSPQANDKALSYLPYTLHEVREIDRILSDKGSVSPRTGKNATEASFFNLSGNSPRILHMATHGFFFNPDDHDKARGLAGVTDPMNLSGLVLSGGNAEWMGLPLPPDTYGGLLTAADIARCDLTGTDLVCLSACHTALGSETTSEGIYGLQRAFKKAGAGTLVMSLWEASEKSATLFMSTFYTQLALNGFNVHEAFSKARAEVRSRYPEPFYWAGFILVD